VTNAHRGHEKRKVGERLEDCGGRFSHEARAGGRFGWDRGPSRNPPVPAFPTPKLRDGCSALFTPKKRARFRISAWGGWNPCRGRANCIMVLSTSQGEEDTGEELTFQIKFPANRGAGLGKLLQKSDFLFSIPAKRGGHVFGCAPSCLVGEHVAAGLLWIGAGWLQKNQSTLPSPPPPARNPPGKGSGPSRRFWPAPLLLTIDF